MNQSSKIYITILVVFIVGMLGAYLFNHFNAWVGISFILLAFGIWVAKFESFGDWLVGKPARKTRRKTASKTTKKK